MASAFGGYSFTDAQDKRRQQRESVPTSSPRCICNSLSMYGMILLRQAQEREQQKALEKQSGMVNTKLTSIQNQLPAFSQNQNPNNPFQLQPPLVQQLEARDAAPPSRRGRRLRPISGTARAHVKVHA